MTPTTSPDPYDQGPANCFDCERRRKINVDGRCQECQEKFDNPPPAHTEIRDGRRVMVGPDGEIQ